MLCSVNASPPSCPWTLASASAYSLYILYTPMHDSVLSHSGTLGGTYRVCTFLTWIKIGIGPMGGSGAERRLDGAKSMRRIRIEVQSTEYFIQGSTTPYISMIVVCQLPRQA